MKISLNKISFPGNAEAVIGAEKSNNLLQNMSNGYVYPSAYTYNGGISYSYNIDQNTKEQMEAYNKLMLASYQNGQQFHSNSQYPKHNSKITQIPPRFSIRFLGCSNYPLKRILKSKQQF